MSQGKITKIFKRSNEIDPTQPRVIFKRENLDETKVKYEGVEDSFEWHQSQEGETLYERSILIQTQENIQELMKLFPDLTSLDKDASFGENLFVEGELSSNVLCIGDIFEIKRDKETICKLQISSPRCPCSKVDFKHSESLKSKPFEEKVRAVSGASALSGFFCRVLQEGTIKKGDEFVLVERMNPKWNLTKTANLVYGGIKNMKRCHLVEFQGSDQELDELLNLKELAITEWKGTLKKYLDKIKNPKKVIEVPKKSEKKEKPVVVESRVNYIIIFLTILVVLLSFKVL